MASGPDESEMFTPMLVPSSKIEMAQTSNRVFGKSNSSNGQLHAMPAIPEDNEVSQIQLSGQQAVMDLLLFALDGDLEGVAATEASLSGLAKASNSSSSSGNSADSVSGSSQSISDKLADKLAEKISEKERKDGGSADGVTEKKQDKKDDWVANFLRTFGIKVDESSGDKENHRNPLNADLEGAVTKRDQHERKIVPINSERSDTVSNGNSVSSNGADANSNGNKGKDAVLDFEGGYLQSGRNESNINGVDLEMGDGKSERDESRGGDVESGGSDVANKANDGQHVNTEAGDVRTRQAAPILAVGAGGLPTSSKPTGQEKHQSFYKIVFLLVFVLVNLEVASVIVLSGLAVGGIGPAVAIIGIGGSLLVMIVLFNVHTRKMRRMILHKYLQVKTKTRLCDLEGLRNGTRVLVRGRVSLLENNIVKSDLQNVEGCVMVETCLQSLEPKGPDSFICKYHVQQTRAVSFLVTDDALGGSCIVNAAAATEKGLMVPVLRIATAVPLTGNSKFWRGLGVDQALVMQTICDNAQLCLHEGYVCEGDVVSVLGILTKTGTSSPTVIDPLTEPRNISKLLFLWNVVPFYYPTWVSGLIVCNEA